VKSDDLAERSQKDQAFQCSERERERERESEYQQNPIVVGGGIFPIRFEVAGGNYRLIAAFDFRRQIVFVKFIGTHAEYDIDALTVARF
jgi:hypothetical protein